MFKKPVGRDFVRIRQQEAPLLRERNQYLTHLLDQGTSARHVRVVAGRLLYIIRLLELTTMRDVNRGELGRATDRWVAHIEAHPTRSLGASTAYTFRNTAEKWLRFHGRLIAAEGPVLPFAEIFKNFMDYISVTCQMSPDSIHNHKTKVSTFLAWVGQRHTQVSQIKLNDVDEYLTHKRTQGLKPRSITANCHSLRKFFRFVESLGLANRSVWLGIKSPPISSDDILPRGPSWSDVKRLLKASPRGTPAKLRTNAILFLAAMYALRGKEIRGLTLDNFNWTNETFSVQRAKRGRIQQFPIQFEAGEAILSYLRNGRPVCSTRELFVTLKPPYRAMHQCVVSKVVKTRMEQLHIEAPQLSPHALRHSCATELLRKGSSLVEIADFLGHQNLKSVGIYAKLDSRSLRKIAAFRLRVR